MKDDIGVTHVSAVLTAALWIGIFCPDRDLQAQEAPADGPQMIKEIVVTGTRIQRSGEDFANPIVAVTADIIEHSGRTNIADLLSKSPALLGSKVGDLTGGSNTANVGDVGVNNLDLRNLGENRTLVLIDGRRHVAGSQGSAAVDTTSIPTDLIESVDVLTGGASAIYGADGVSGVVNFRMKRNLEGLTVRAQTGISRYGDGTNQFAAVTYGHNFADGRANAAIAFEYNVDSRVYDQRRPFLRDPGAGNLYRNQYDIPHTHGVPFEIPYHNVRYADSSTKGAVDVTFDGIPDFEGSGAVYDRGMILQEAGGYTIGGSSTPVAGYQGDLFPGVRRYIVNGIGHFDLNDKVTLFADAKFAEVHARSLSQPNFDVLQFINADNPFIPQSIRNAIVPGAAATYFGDPNQPDGVLVTRDNFDMGINSEETRRRTVRGVLGASGTLSEHLRYEASYVYGVTNARIETKGNRVTPRWLAAIDAVTDPATGKPTCRSNLAPNPDPFLAGCIPYNIFGDNVRDPAAIPFVTTTDISYAKISQQVLSGSISGDLGNSLRFSGGSVGYAVGAEYRRESSDFTPDALLSQGLTWLGKVAPASGAFNVKEVFAEVNVPILADRPGAHLLSVGSAARLSDYSTIGRTATWKFDGIYAPIASVSMRGTYAQAVRAPNIAELFAPSSVQNKFFVDPCDISQTGSGSSTRAANCATLLTALGIDPTTFQPSTSTISSIAVAGVSSGNLKLSEETARTWTAGVVWKPAFIANFSATVDWYNIRIKQAISTPEPQQLSELCVDQPSLNNPFCPLITRDPKNGFINGFRVKPQNVSNFQTAGLDATINYHITTHSTGSFDLQLVGNYISRLEFISTPGAQPRSDLAQQYEPRYSGVFNLTWQLSKMTVTYGVNWFSPTKRYTDAQVAGDTVAAPPYRHAKAAWEQNIQGAYEINDRVSVLAGVNNLFDEKPEFGYRSYPVSALGRFFYVGAKAHY